MVSVKLEREDEEEVSPHVIAPFFPQVSVWVCSTVVVWLLTHLHLLCFSLLPQKREEGWWVVIGDPKSNRYTLYHKQNPIQAISVEYVVFPSSPSTHSHHKPAFHQEADTTDKGQGEA